MTHVLHGLDARAQVVVGPDDHAHAPVLKISGGCGVVLSWYNDHWLAVVPVLHERLDLRRVCQLGVHENCIGTGVGVRLSPLQRLLEPPACDESFHACNDTEGFVFLYALASCSTHEARLVDSVAALHTLDLSTKFFD